MEGKKKFAHQIALVEKARSETGLRDEEIAEILVIKPETLRKVAQGYQSAGKRLLADLEKLPDLPSLKARQQDAETRGKSKPSARPKVPALAHRIAFIMANALPEEEALVTKIIDAAFEQVAKRIADEK